MKQILWRLWQESECGVECSGEAQEEHGRVDVVEEGAYRTGKQDTEVPSELVESAQLATYATLHQLTDGIFIN